MRRLLQAALIELVALLRLRAAASRPGVSGASFCCLSFVWPGGASGSSSPRPPAPRLPSAGASAGALAFSSRRAGYLCENQIPGGHENY